MIRRIMKYILTLTLLVSFSAAFTGCLKDEEITQANTSKAIEDYISENNIAATTTASGLSYVITEPGSSRRVKDESTIKVSITVRTTDNTLVVNTNGLTFLNLANQIEGLKEGLEYIGEGGKITLYIPYELAWGVNGNGSIPPLADVIVQVNIDDILLYVEDYIKENNFTITDSTTTKVRILIEEEGDGEFPMQTSIVDVSYKGYFTNGEEFDSNDEGIRFGLANVIQGWREGIPKFSRGAKGKLFIPWEVGYGVDGSSAIPPRTDLVFDIELNDWE